MKFKGTVSGRAQGGELLGKVCARTQFYRRLAFFDGLIGEMVLEGCVDGVMKRYKNVEKIGHRNRFPRLS